MYGIGLNGDFCVGAFLGIIGILLNGYCIHLLAPLLILLLFLLLLLLVAVSTVVVVGIVLIVVVAVLLHGGCCNHHLLLHCCHLRRHHLLEPVFVGFVFSAVWFSFHLRNFLKYFPHLHFYYYSLSHFL